MHACRCARALDVVPSDEITLFKVALARSTLLLIPSNFMTMIPWYDQHISTKFDPYLDSGIREQCSVHYGA